MRLKERIPIVLDKIDIAQFLYDIGYSLEINSEEMKSIVQNFIIHKKN